MTAAEKGLTTLRLETDLPDLHDLSRQLFFAFAREKKALLELNLKKANLEDIFLELTDKQPQAEPASGEQDKKEAEPS